MACAVYRFFASLLTVAMTYAIGVRLFSRVPALLASLFVGLNTFSIYYAQEARMYALLALLASISMWLFVQWMPLRADVRNHCRFRWGVALAITNAVGLYTHYAYPLVMVVQGGMFVLWIGAEVWQVYRQRGHIWESIRQSALYIGINLMTIVLFLPQLSIALAQLGGWGQADALLSPQMAVGKLLAYLSVGITLGTGLSISIVFFLLFALLQFADDPRRMWWHVAFPVMWVLVPMAIFLGFGLYREANLKFLLIAQVGFALWLGRGIWALWHLKPRQAGRNSEMIPKVAAVVGCISIVNIFLVGIPALYTDFQRDDYRGMAMRIQSEEHTGDAIVLTAPNQMEVFRYYYTGELPIYALPEGLGGDDDATYAQIIHIIADHPRIFALFWAQSERDPNNIVEGTLDTQAYEADAQWYGGVRFTRYIAPLHFDDFTPADVRFGEHIRMVQYALNADTLRAGDVLQVQLHWQADAPIEMRYKVFVQLLDVQGQVVAQRDAEPSAWNRPTITWAVDEIITDQHALIIPNNLPQAHYTLIIGLYNADNPSARLAVGDADYFILAKITLE